MAPMSRSPPYPNKKKTSVCDFSINEVGNNGNNSIIYVIYHHTNYNIQSTAVVHVSDLATTLEVDKDTH